METVPRITPLMSNNELDNWADIYAQARIGEVVSITFSEFIQSPWAHLARAGQETAPESIENGFLPLLPVQAEASRRIQGEWNSQSRKAASSKSHLALVASN